MPIIRNVHGRNIPITPPKPKVATAALVGVATIAAMSGGGFVGAGGAGFGGGSGASSILRAKTARGKADARTGNSARAWQRMGMRQLRRQADRATNCAARSYGDVRQFFARQPCRSLQRVLLMVGDGDGMMVVSISWVRMPTVGTAERLKSLADVDGTGNVSPIGLPALTAGGIEFTGMHYASRRGGTLAVIAEVEPAKGRPDDRTMDAVAEVAAEFPPP